MRAGDVAEISASFSDSGVHKLTVAGTMIEDKATFEASSVEAVRKILEVDAKGVPVKAAYQISSLTSQIGKSGKLVEILDSGTEVVAEFRQGKTTFLIGGKTPANSVLRFLRRHIQIRPLAPSLDITFKTSTARAVGDEWDTDLEEMLDSAPETVLFEVDKGTSTAKVRFEGTKAVDGIDCGVLHLDISIKILRMKWPKAPKVLNSRLFKRSSVSAPLDKSLPLLCLRNEVDTSLMSEYLTPEKQVARLDQSNKVTQWVKCKPRM